MRYAGISIFFRGNKMQNGGIVNADGVQKEFEIAEKLGLLLIPVGASGYMAEKLWEQVIADRKKYYPNATDKFVEAIKSLGDKVAEPDMLISKIVDVLELA
jgi:hypothetical protein